MKENILLLLIGLTLYGIVGCEKKKPRFSMIEPNLASRGIEWQSNAGKIFWKLQSPEMIPGCAKEHNDPHEVELYFIGSDGRKWRAVKWERMP